MNHDLRSAPSNQANGPRWTHRKMAEFLQELAATRSVKAAARSVGMSRQSAYKLRARLKRKPFGLGWDEALRPVERKVPSALMERALYGVERPHYYRGKLLGTSRRYDERLSIALLKLCTSPGVVVAGNEDRATVSGGTRLDGLIARILAEGDAEADGAALSRGESANLSPRSDARKTAELRGFGGDARG